MGDKSTIQKFYVVFQGRNPGIYSSWTECEAQVSGFKGNRHRSYASYEEALSEWIRFCTKHTAGEESSGNEPFHQKMEDPVGMASSQSHGCHQGDVAIDTGSDVFLVQQCMEQLLSHICTLLHYSQPVYSMYDVKTIHGIQCTRYCGTLEHGEVGSHVCLGKFAEKVYDAREDVAACLLRRLLATTGKCIRDFNYYNVKILETQLQKLLDEKLELQMELAILTEKLRHLSSQKAPHE